MKFSKKKFLQIGIPLILATILIVFLFNIQPKTKFGNYSEIMSNKWKDVKSKR